MRSEGLACPGLLLSLGDIASHAQQLTKVLRDGQVFGRAVEVLDARCDEAPGCTRREKRGEARGRGSERKSLNSDSLSPSCNLLTT